MIMEQIRINIYLPPGMDTTGYPVSLSGDFNMSADYRIESSWMFFLMLKGEGLPVKICREYPKRGILLIHKAFTEKFVWNPDLFVVSMQWDYKRDDRGQVHLVSNGYQMRAFASGWMDWVTFTGLRCFAPPPMHPLLTPRNFTRGDLFETVAFIGAEKNLEAEFRTTEFKARIAGLGMKFILVDNPEDMTDYSGIDVVLAVRKLGQQVLHKPAQKLINAWRAGVPALLGCEVGFRELKYSNLDYLEVNSADDVVVCLKRLRDDVEFRNVVIANGLLKAESYTIGEAQRMWAKLFREKIIPGYKEWKKTSYLSRIGFLAVRRFRNFLRRSLSFIWHRVLGVKPKL